MAAQFLSFDEDDGGSSGRSSSSISPNGRKRPLGSHSLGDFPSVAIAAASPAVIADRRAALRSSSAFSPGPSPISSPTGGVGSIDITELSLESVDEQKRLDQFEAEMTRVGGAHNTRFCRFSSIDKSAFPGLVAQEDLVGTEAIWSALCRHIGRNFDGPVLAPQRVPILAFKGEKTGIRTTVMSWCAYRQINYCEYFPFSEEESKNKDYFSNVFSLLVANRPAVFYVARMTEKAGMMSSAFYTRIAEAYLQYAKLNENNFMRCAPPFWIVCGDKFAPEYYNPALKTSLVSTVAAYSRERQAEYLEKVIAKRLRMAFEDYKTVPEEMIAEYRSEIGRITEAHPTLFEKYSDMSAYVDLLFRIPVDRRQDDEVASATGMILVKDFFPNVVDFNDFDTAAAKCLEIAREAEANRKRLELMQQQNAAYQAQQHRLQNRHHH